MIELPIPVENRLIHAAQESGQNLASFIETLLDEYIEDQRDVKIAEAAYREFIQSGESAIPFSQVMSDNGL